MGKDLQHLRVKIGKRYWMLVVMQSMEPPANLRDFLVNTPDKPDLFLIFGLDEDLRQRWVETVTAQCGKDWETRFIAGDRLSNLDLSSSEACLVVGQQRLLQGFCNLVAPGKEASNNRSEAEDTAKQIRLYPNLPDPSEVPRFREEDNLDPFGQNPRLLNTAWLNVARLVGQLAKKAHTHGIAITLPLPTPGQIEPRLKPWRTVVSLDCRSDNISPAEVAKQENLSPSQIEEIDTGLNLIQRCLLTLTAFPPDVANKSDWHDVAKMLEELGYMLISHSLDIKMYPDLQPFCGVGLFVAVIHSGNAIHGDIHPGNFVIEEDNSSEKGISITCIDSNLCILDRPLTALERAKDLAILKFHCTFIQWEAVKHGYCSMAPEEAEEVFQLI